VCLENTDAPKAPAVIGIAAAPCANRRRESLELPVPSDLLLLFVEEDL
jgi:hypothetical protein